MILRTFTNINRTISKLIEMTQEDIYLIKQAKHDELALRMAYKNEAILEFETHKSLLNHELATLVEENPNSQIDEILNDEANIKFDAFKDSLLELKNINKEFSKYVITINEFYNSLFDEMFELDRKGYEKTNPVPAVLFNIGA
jgi:hypothetical protein